MQLVSDFVDSLDQGALYVCVSMGGVVSYILVLRLLSVLFFVRWVSFYHCNSGGSPRLCYVIPPSLSRVQP